MKHGKISFKNLEVFGELINHGSFTNTAKALGVTKAAVSHSIKQLENDLKVDLLIRTTRSISLTDEGKLLLYRCKSLKKELDSIRDLSESFHKEPAGLLKISLNSFFAENVLLNIITEYQQKFPKVKLDINIEEKMPDIKSNDIDIVFGVNWTPPEDIIARKIGHTRYILCASPKYIEAKGEPKNIEDLKNHLFIPHKSRDTKIVGLKENLPGLQIDSCITADNISFMKKCVMSGLGVAQFHEYVVKAELENGKLIELLGNYFESNQPLYIYYQKNKFVQPKVKEFVNLVLAN